VPTPTDDRRDLLTGSPTCAAPGKRDDPPGSARSTDRADAAGEGVHQLRPAPGDEDPEAFFFYENWESGGHLAAPHLQEFAARIPEPLDQNGLTVNRVRSFA
jgi:quinol monooxygenase YgiN